VANSNYAAILAAVVEVVQGVSGVGVVHNRQRFLPVWKDFLAAHSSGGILNGWSVSRETSPEDPLTNRETDRSHVFVIRSWFGMNDAAASENTFQARLESVCDAFRAVANYDLGGAAEWTLPAAVRLVQLREIGGVLCHYGEITVTAHERIARG
jgi:hypothetical protein